jgi:hypothetical protein
MTVDNAMFRDFRKQIVTRVAFASIYHPQSNGAVKRANSLIFDAIKNKLQGEKKENGQRSANRSVEPQHHSAQSNKLYTF